MLRAFFLLPTLLFILPMLLIGGALLVFKGSPGQCGNGRQVFVDPALAFSYDERWFDFNQTLLDGLPATISVNESEATSRAQLFLALSGAPIDDVRLCFTDGASEANGTISTPLGGDVAVRLRGNVALTGLHPEPNIESIHIGGVPSVMTRPFNRLISRVVDREMKKIILFQRMTVEVREGEAVITGQP